MEGVPSWTTSRIEYDYNIYAAYDLSRRAAFTFGTIFVP